MKLCLTEIFLILGPIFGESSKVLISSDDELQSVVYHQSKVIDNLVGKIEALEKANAFQWIRNHETESEIQKIQADYYKELELLKQKIKNLELKDDIENTYMALQSEERNVNVVAFHAYHGPDSRTYQIGEMVIFAIEVTNIGPDGTLYNPETGVFHCGVSGLYFFTMTLLTNSGAYGAITVGESEIAWAYGNGGSETGTASGVVFCQDQDVFVRIIRGASNYREDQFSTFSGYLLQIQA